MGLLNVNWRINYTQFRFHLWLVTLTKEGPEILTAVLMTIQAFWDATPR